MRMCIKDNKCLMQMENAIGSLVISKLRFINRLPFMWQCFNVNDYQAISLKITYYTYK